MRQNGIMQLIVPSFFCLFAIHFPIHFSPIPLQIDITSKRIKLQTCGCCQFVANLKVLLMVSYLLYLSFDKTVKMPYEASCVFYAPSGINMHHHRLRLLHHYPHYPLPITQLPKTCDISLSRVDKSTSLTESASRPRGKRVDITQH